MPEWLKYLLELTAQEMKQPPMFGGFHIGAAVLAVLIPCPEVSARQPCTGNPAAFGMRMDPGPYGDLQAAVSVCHRQ